MAEPSPSYEELKARVAELEKQAAGPVLASWNSKSVNRAA